MNAAAEISSSKKASLWRRYWAEFCLFLAIAAAGGVIQFQHRIFGRDISISQNSDQSALLFSSYTDLVNQGQSTLRSSKPLQWDCTIRAGFSLPYCAYEVVLDGNGANRGMDLSNMEAIELTLDYKGPPATFRFNLKNEDLRYSKHGDRGTSKVNKAEFSIVPGRNTIILRPQDFSVADWWLNIFKVTPELSRTQIDNVVAAEFVTGTVTAPGDYRFSVKSLRVVRSSISPAQLYLTIVGLLVVGILIYTLVRVHRSRAEAREREQLEGFARQALADAASAAQRASEAKSDFLASMSHELRTPLNAVLGYAQLLERTQLPEKELNSVRIIRRSGNHLLTLITDTLDIAKIEAGKMELNRTPCDLRALIGGAVDMVRPTAEQKGLSLTCTIADEAPNGIEADGKRLRQILLNLLGNATKFTAEGRVSLVVTPLDFDTENVTLRFEVQDSGPGIAPEDMDRVFQPFGQAGDAAQREGGTGLGLTITRQLLSLMHTDIEVQSRPRQGSTFWFDVSLPIVETEDTEAAIDPARIGGYAGVRRHILIVDDMEANRDLLMTFLAPLGFECSLAHNGVEALQVAQDKKPDLVLMDLKMPVMDGYEATRIMRIIDTLKTVPILALSANIAEESAVAAMTAGANGFLSKPVDQGELLLAIRRWCNIEWIEAQKQVA